MNWKNYIREFNAKPPIISLLLVSVIFVLGEEVTRPRFNKYLINPIFSKITHSYETDIVIVLIMTCCFAFSLLQIQKGLRPSINSVCLSCIFIGVYYFFIRESSYYSLFPFTFEFLNNIFYLDALVLSVVFVSSSYKTYRKEFNGGDSVFGMIDDTPSVSKYKDLFGREGFAKTIANTIKNSNSDSSVAIAVVGEWGSGKTDFMLRLKEVLVAESNRSVVLDFNPWRISSPDNMGEEFFKTLAISLKKFNRSITSVIADYSSRVLKSAKETHFRIFDAVIHNWFKHGDIQHQYNLINRAIACTGKQFIVFIDDVDRLSGKEIMEVLRIIRNSANFSNLFFIVGIDQSYVISALKETKTYANEEQYLKKVFQLTINLPAIKKSQYMWEILNFLRVSEMPAEEKLDIESAFSRISSVLSNSSLDTYTDSAEIRVENIVETLIGSLRDLKRFCNSLKITYEMLKNEVDTMDLIILELIRNSDVNTYLKIRNREIIEINPDNQSHFQIKLELEKDLKDKSIRKIALDQALNILFLDAPYKNQRKIVKVENFFIYFSYQIFNRLSLKEFYKNYYASPVETEDYFKICLRDNKGQELIRILLDKGDFKDTDEFRKIVVILLRLSEPNSDLSQLVQHWLFNEFKINLSKYFNSEETQQWLFIKEIFDNKSISPYNRANLASIFLYNIIATPEIAPLMIYKTDIQEIILTLFGEHLLFNAQPYSLTHSFYLLNYFEIGEAKIMYFNPVAAEMYKKYLLENNDAFSNYSARIFRAYKLPFDGKVAVDPSLLDVFGHVNIFFNNLAKLASSDQELEHRVQIITKYLSKIYSLKEKYFIPEKKDEQYIQRMVEEGIQIK